MTNRTGGILVTGIPGKPAGIVVYPGEKMPRGVPSINSKKRFYFDPDKAFLPIDWYQRNLFFTKGRLARKPVVLADFQREWIGNIFGWIDRETGFRKYRAAYIEVPKKSSKSFICAGLSLYMMCVEYGASVFCVSGSRDQAGIVFDECKAMANLSPNLLKHMTINALNISIDERNAFLRPLSANSDTSQGINASTVVMDELHIMDRALVESLKEAGASFEQPLVIAITTAGIYDSTSVGYEYHDRAKKIAQVPSMNEAQYVYIMSAELVAKNGVFKEYPGADWRDQKVWERCNPGLGITKTFHSISDSVRDSIGSPAAQASTKRYHMNYWNQEANHFIDIDKYKECEGGFDPRELAGQRCYAGLDLSRKTDLTALVLVFPPDKDGSPYRVIPHFWKPEEGLAEAMKRDNQPYSEWESLGFIYTTPGLTIQYSYIRAKLNQLATIYDIAEVPFDAWNASNLVEQLEVDDGFTMVEYPQTPKALSSPTKELQALILEGNIQFDVNPCMLWNMANLCVKSDVSENIRPVKGVSTGRIDGAVALIMALDRAINGSETVCKYTAGQIFFDEDDDA